MHFYYPYKLKLYNNVTKKFMSIYITRFTQNLTRSQTDQNLNETTL